MKTNNMKKYNLKTLKEIIDVVDDKNFNLFIFDFVKWLSIQVAIKNNKSIQDKNPDTFNWIDDGKNDSSIMVEIK